MSLKDTFAANLKRITAKRGFTQEQLAAKAGLSVSYISMLQRGQRSPPLETIEVLAEALGVPAVKLLAG